MSKRGGISTWYKTEDFRYNLPISIAALWNKILFQSEYCYVNFIREINIIIPTR